MASDEESLKALENLMTEFFDGHTTNERKREIEAVLNSFSQQNGSWRHCIFFMGNTKNEYVMMYCMTVLENLINKQWIGLQGSDKMEIRSTLYKYLMVHQKEAPNFIRNKLVKLVVDIGRLDWPHFYPDFFSSTLQLVQQSQTTTLGLILLQTTSEELACPREDLSVCRKEELQWLLLEQVPTVLNILNGILESILEKHRHLVTATPPPSPTHGQSSDNHRSLFSTSPLHTGSILSGMFKSPSMKDHFYPLPPLDASSHHICTLALNCLAHLFSWIPLSTFITPTLLTTVFHFASFGCESSKSPNLTLQSTSSNAINGNSSLGVLAMGCINEIMSKNCVPAEFEDFLLQLFQNTFCLLQKLAKENNSNSTANRLADLDESYLEKFTEFLRLFVGVHLRRFESNNQFPVLEFLALLFKYTFQQPSHEGFFACLDIWGIFLDYLSIRLKNRSSDAASVLERYKEAFVSLLTQLLRKLQFRFNQAQLEELDDESLDDDSETEWQHFLRQCLETVAKLAELIPTDAFGLLYRPFQEYLEIYLGLEHYILSSQGSKKLNVTAENECRRLHCTLRDLSSLLQGLGRLADHFIGEPFMERFSNAQTIVERLCQTVIYGTKVMLYELDTAVPVLKPDFVEVHAQALASVKAFSHWMAQYYWESLRQGQQEKEFAALITNLVNSMVPLLQKEVPEKIVHSTAHLLVSLTNTVRPVFLFSLPSIQSMYNDITLDMGNKFSQEVRLLIFRSLSNVLILPWPNMSDNDQEWAGRSESHHRFLKMLTEQYRQIKDMPQFADNKSLHDQAQPITKKTLQVLTDLVINISSEVTKTKQICYHSIQESLQVTLYLFPVYIHQPDVVEEILSFFLAVFEALRVQMGVPYAEQTIQIFMNLFTRDRLVESILHESGVGCRVVEKFLKILQLIVQEPGSAFKAFLTNIISLCMDQIYHIIAERVSPDVKPSLFDLLYNILLHNWRYFFKTSILTSLQTGTDQVENQAQFISIMQAFGQSFLQPDISVFKQNLEALESLNTKWKLYHKMIFKEMMQFQFLNVLIQVLVHKSHDLLQEEIGISIYNMASVDFDGFYSNFLTQFLSGCDGLDSNQKSILAHNFKVETDLPSFTHSVHRFVNDLRYYRLCNNSLPEGTVKF